MEDVFFLSPQLVIESFDDGDLVMDTSSRMIVELNTLGSYIIACTDGKRDVAQVAQMVAASFEVAETEALEDVSFFYHDLVNRNLVGVVQNKHTS